MKNKTFTRFLRAFAVAVALLLIQGCASNGYISSSITTGIGLDVSENSQTQIPHVRFGYIRHGLYYIPTGATTNGGGDVAKTPHVVSKIHVKSEFLKTMEITEKFAVGDNAGDTAAAKQLFMEPARSEGGVAGVGGHVTVSDNGRGADERERRKEVARSQKVIHTTVDSNLFRASVHNQETNQDREKNNIAFSGLLSEIAKRFPDRRSNPAVLTPAYQAVLDDPAVKTIGLPATTPDLISLTRTFQDGATTTEQRAAMTIGAKNVADSLKKK